VTVKEQWDSIPETIKLWGGAILVLGTIWSMTLTVLVATPIANAVLPLSRAIDGLQADRKEDRQAIVELKVAVAGLTSAVSAMRRYDVPMVADKVDVVSDEATATKAQLRSAADRNFAAVQQLTQKVDSVLVLQKRSVPARPPVRRP
jgi:type III secretory pathway lipoprotein EscJ